MPRTARPDTPGYPHHLISRFMNRARRICSPAERARYLDALGTAAVRAAAFILGFCAMSTHTHVVGPGDSLSVGGLVHRANTTYGAWWNQLTGGFGRVFAERPRSIVVYAEEQLARLIAYVHNNPVRAGLVKCPADSDWSSHRCFIGEAKAPEWLDVARVLATIGYSSTPSGRAAFHDFVVSRAHLPRDPMLAGPGPLPPGACVRLVEVVASQMGVSPEKLLRPGSDQHASAARLRLLRVATDVFGISQLVSEATGLSRSMVSKLAGPARAVGLIPGGDVERIVEEFLQRSGREAA